MQVARTCKLTQKVCIHVFAENTKTSWDKKLKITQLLNKETLKPTFSVCRSERKLL